MSPRDEKDELESNGEQNPSSDVAGAPEEDPAVGREGAPGGVERRDPKRRRRARLLGRVLGLISLAIAFSLFLFTQTSTGRNAAVVLLQGALENAIDGSVRIGPVLGGNLVTRTVVSSFEIADTDGRTFVAMDTVSIEYDPLLLLRRQIRIRRLDAARAEIRLAVGTDGRWNFERIFRGAGEAALSTDSTIVESGPAVPDSASSSEPVTVPANPLRLVITDATLRDGVLEIRQPWTEGLEGRDRDRALAEARSPDAIWYSEETAAGEFERVYRVENMSGSFPELRLVDPPRPLEVDLEGVSGRVWMVALPLDVRSFDGGVTFGDTVRVAIDRFETDLSRLSGAGSLVPGETLEFDFELDAEQMAFEDLAWLPLPLPATGGGPMRIDLESRGPTPVITVGGARVRSGETSITGGFRLAIENAPRFESLDATFDPLSIAWLDDVLEREPTIEGFASGTLRGSGRIDALDIDAELTLRSADSASTRAPSVVSASGGVSLQEPFPVRRLALTLRGFQPEWTRILGFDTGLPGLIGGSATIDRPDGGVLTFAGDVSHLSDEGDLSVLSGTGAVDFEERSVLDFDIEAAPLALGALRPWLPDVDLVGEVTGPIRTSGSATSLLAQADLTTPRGQLNVSGLFGFDGEEPTYDATLTASDIALDQWIQNAPESRLAIRGRVTGSGIDPATLHATFDLEILPSALDRAEIDNSRLRFDVADGLARIDTFIVQADVGSISGRGDFGFADDRSGRLEFEAVAADLSELNRWVAEDIPGGREADAGEELFADFAAAIAVPSPEEEVEGLVGRAEARGTIAGTLEEFSVDVLVNAADVRFGSWEADSLTARVGLARPPTIESIDGRLVAVGALVDGIQLDSVAVDVLRDAGGPFEANVFGRRDSTVVVSARGDVERVPGGVAVGLEAAGIRLGKLESTLLNPAQVVYSDSLIVARGLSVSGLLGRIEADGAISRAGDGSLALRLDGIRVDQLGHLWSDQPRVGGTLSGSGVLSGTLDTPVFQGSIRVLDPAVFEHRYTSLGARFDYADRRLDGSMDLTRDGSRLARMEAEVRADLRIGKVERRLLDDPLEFRLVADSLPLQLLELRVSGLEQIDGVGVGTVTLAGEPGQMRYGGSLSVQDGTAWVPDLGIRFVGVEGAATFSGREARIDGLTLASETGGAGTVSGAVDLSTLTDPEFDLTIETRVLRAVSRRDVELAIDGTGRLGGSYTAPVLTGRFRLRDGDIRQDELLRERQVIDLSDPQFLGLLDSTFVAERQLLDRFRNPFMDNLLVDIQLDLGPNLWLRSPTLDVEMVAQALDVRMNRAGDQLFVVGNVDLPRGTYRFDRIPPYQQTLRITEGTIQFVGSEEFNPNLAISAQYRGRTQDAPVLIEVAIGGTLLNTDLRFSSSPPMSDTDQLCFLAVGAPCAGSSDRQLGQRLAREAVLGTLSTGLSSALVGSSGLSYFNLTSTGGSTAAGGLRGSENLWDTTALEFGWYASDSVFFTFRQPLGGGFPRATMEWRFNPVWTFEAKASSRFDDRLFGFRHSSLADQQTFGLFLYREWSY